MKGRQRLRIAPIGELRRRWACLASLNDLNKRYEVVNPVEGSEVESDELMWSSSLLSPRCKSDPSHGDKPEGDVNRFWEDDSICTWVSDSRPQSPSTESLRRRARDAGFSSDQINETTMLLADPDKRQLIVSRLTPTTLDRPTNIARKVVSTLFQGRKQSLSGPRVSTSVTIGDYPVTDRRGGSPR